MAGNDGVSKMNSKLLLLTSACGLFILSPARADAQTQTPRGFEVGAEVLDYSYRERFDWARLFDSSTANEAFRTPFFRVQRPSKMLQNLVERLLRP